MTGRCAWAIALAAALAGGCTFLAPAGRSAAETAPVDVCLYHETGVQPAEVLARLADGGFAPRVVFVCPWQRSAFTTLGELERFAELIPYRPERCAHNLLVLAPRPYDYLWAVLLPTVHGATRIAADGARTHAVSMGLLALNHEFAHLRGRDDFF